MTSRALTGGEPPSDIEMLRAHGRHEHDEAPNPDCRACDKSSGGRAGRVEAEGLTLVRRGKRVGAEGEAASYEWWQELPEGESAEALRSVGYEVRELVPASLLAAERERREEAELGPAPTRSELEVQAENVRLRDLYENAVQHEKRFGWTINHLLECEEALRCAEADLEALRERRTHTYDTEERR